MTAVRASGGDDGCTGGRQGVWRVMRVDGCGSDDQRVTLELVNFAITNFGVNKKLIIKSDELTYIHGAWALQEKLWKVGKSEDVGLKARKKLNRTKRESSARVGRSRADDCGGVVCSGAKDLRFIGRVP